MLLGHSCKREAKAKVAAENVGNRKEETKIYIFLSFHFVAVNHQRVQLPKEIHTMEETFCFSKFPFLAILPRRKVQESWKNIDLLKFSMVIELLKVEIAF